MLEKIKNTIEGIQDKKWIIAAIAAGISVAAAVIGVLVYFSKKEDEEESIFEEE